MVWFEGAGFSPTGKVNTRAAPNLLGKHPTGLGAGVTGNPKVAVIALLIRPAFALKNYLAYVKLVVLFALCGNVTVSGNPSKRYADNRVDEH
jgi:hypothetical protein